MLSALQQSAIIPCIMAVSTILNYSVKSVLCGRASQVQECIFMSAYISGGCKYHMLLERNVLRLTAI